MRTQTIAIFVMWATCYAAAVASHDNIAFNVAILGAFVVVAWFFWGAE